MGAKVGRRVPALSRAHPPTASMRGEGARAAAANAAANAAVNAAAADGRWRSMEGRGGHLELSRRPPWCGGILNRALKAAALDD